MQFDIEWGLNVTSSEPIWKGGPITVRISLTTHRVQGTLEKPFTYPLMLLKHKKVHISQFCFDFRMLMSRLIEVCCESERGRFKPILMFITLKSILELKYEHLGVSVFCSLTFIFYLLLVPLLCHPLHLQPQLLLLGLKSLPLLLFLLLCPALLFPLLVALLLHLQYIHTISFRSVLL